MRLLIERQYLSESHTRRVPRSLRPDSFAPGSPFRRASRWLPTHSSDRTCVPVARQTVRTARGATDALATAGAIAATTTASAAATDRYFFRPAVRRLSRRQESLDNVDTFLRTRAAARLPQKPPDRTNRHPSQSEC
jgi:hypothetical protein